MDSPDHLIIRRVTTVTKIRDHSGKTVGYKAECSHRTPPEKKLYPVEMWGIEMSFELAQDWALNHKCSGEKLDSRKVQNNG